MGLIEDLYSEGLISSDSLPKLDDNLPQNIAVGNDAKAGNMPGGLGKATPLQDVPTAPEATGGGSAGASPISAMPGMPEPDFSGDGEGAGEDPDTEGGEPTDSEGGEPEDSGSEGEPEQQEPSGEDESEPEPEAKESKETESSFDVRESVFKLTEHFLKEMLSGMKEGSDDSERESIEAAIKAISTLSGKGKELNASKSSEERKASPANTAARYLEWANKNGHEEAKVKDKLKNLFGGNEEKVDELLAKTKGSSDRESVLKVMNELGLS